MVLLAHNGAPQGSAARDPPTSSRQLNQPILFFAEGPTLLTLVQSLATANSFSSGKFTEESPT